MTRFLSCSAVLLSLASIAPGADRKPPPDYTGSCTDACHQAQTKHRVVHDPVSDGSSDTCHVVVDKKDHRFKLTAQGGALCTECHDAPVGKVEHDPVAHSNLIAVDPLQLPSTPVGTDDDLASNRALVAASHAVRRAYPMLAEDRKLEGSQELDLSDQTVPSLPPSSAP